MSESVLSLPQPTQDTLLDRPHGCRPMNLLANSFRLRGHRLFLRHHTDRSCTLEAVLNPTVYASLDQAVPQPIEPAVTKQAFKIRMKPHDTMMMPYVDQLGRFVGEVERSLMKDYIQILFLVVETQLDHDIEKVARRGALLNKALQCGMLVRVDGLRMGCFEDDRGSVSVR